MLYSGREVVRPGNLFLAFALHRNLSIVKTEKFATQHNLDMRHYTEIDILFFPGPTTSGNVLVLRTRKS